GAVFWVDFIRQHSVWGRIQRRQFGQWDAVRPQHRWHGLHESAYFRGRQRWGSSDWQIAFIRQHLVWHGAARGHFGQWHSVLYQDQRHGFHNPAQLYGTL